MVHTGFAPPEKMPAKRHLIASLSNGYEKLIGDEVNLAQRYSCSPEKAIMAWQGLFRLRKYRRNAPKYWMARRTLPVTTIARA
jgi:hypothetical protein